MYKNQDDNVQYGVTLITGDKCKCAIVTINKNKPTEIIDYKIIQKSKHQLQKKQKKGGQSAQRFGRIRLEIEDHCIDRISDQLVNSYYHDNNTRCSIIGLILVGSAELKNKVVKTSKFAQYFQNYLCGVVNSGETEITNNLIQETIPLVQDKIFMEYNLYLEEIKSAMTNADDKLVFGVDIMKNLYENNLEKLYVGDNENNEEIFANKGSCEIIVLPSALLESIGLNMAGFKYYSEDYFSD